MRKKGDPARSGWIAEQRSWTNARQGQLAGAEAAADLRRALAHDDRKARARQREGGGEPVRAGPDDDRVGSQWTSAGSEARVSRSISRAITIRWISCVPS